MNETLLLDTDVSSYLFKRSKHAEQFRPIVEGKRLALSFMTVAELYRWAVERNWGQQKVAQLEAALRRYVIIPYDNDLAWAWARVMAGCRSVGSEMPPSDAWIAATAIRHDLGLVTNNVKHFEPAEQACDLRLIRVSDSQ